MPIGLLFWILMILWMISWFGTRFGGFTGYMYASDFLFFVLLFLLGWKEFGFILQGGGMH